MSILAKKTSRSFLHHKSFLIFIDNPPAWKGKPIEKFKTVAYSYFFNWVYGIFRSNGLLCIYFCSINLTQLVFLSYLVQIGGYFSLSFKWMGSLKSFAVLLNNESPTWTFCEIKTNSFILYRSTVLRDVPWVFSLFVRAFQYRALVKAILCGKVLAWL